MWIEAAPSRVFEALATAEWLGRWWAPHASEHDRERLVLSHDPGPEHGKVRMLVLESVESRRIVWEIVSEHPPTSPAHGWMGTRISFDIQERDNPGPRLGIAATSPRLTVVDFRHSGWDGTSEYLGFCSFAWAETLLMLRKWCQG